MFSQGANYVDIPKSSKAGSTDYQNMASTMRLIVHFTLFEINKGKLREKRSIRRFRTCNDKNMLLAMQQRLQPRSNFASYQSGPKQKGNGEHVPDFFFTANNTS